MATQSVCKIDGCDNPAGVSGAGNGMCRSHYRAERDARPDRKLCAVAGCDNPTNSKGYCGKHAYKFKTYGDPLAGRTSASPGEPLAWIQEHKNATQDECLLWPYEIAANGYGVVTRDGKRRAASRDMCEAAHGPPPTDGLDAAHSCHNPPCCNPRHLRWATRRENNMDKFENGTAMCGEKVIWAKLTEAQVLEIRCLAGVPQSELAETYGVQQSTISRILSGKRWGWLHGEQREIHSRC